MISIEKIEHVYKIVQNQIENKEKRKGKID
jgi:hypothetical protein